MDVEILKVFDLARKPEHSSKTHPDLPNKAGGPDNWVEKVGGLPSYIKRVAKHIFYDSPGMTVSHAIAAAVQQIKKWAAQGKPEAIKALAEWTAKKGAAHSLGYSDGDVEYYDMALLIQKKKTAYSTAGNNASAKGTGVRGSAFEEHKHPRQQGGKFGTKLSPGDLIAARRQIEGLLSTLGMGQSVNLPNKVGWVKRTPGGYFVQGGGGFTASVRTLSEAIQAAAQLLAQKGK